jgi:hypothetical protein
MFVIVYKNGHKYVIRVNIKLEGPLFSYVSVFELLFPCTVKKIVLNNRELSSTWVATKVSCYICKEAGNK